MWEAEKSERAVDAALGECEAVRGKDYSVRDSASLSAQAVFEIDQHLMLK